METTILDKYTTSTDLLIDLKVDKNIHGIFPEIKKQISKNKQHQKGKLTAFERINILADKDSLSESSSFIETGKYVQHQCVNFDMHSKKNIGDGVLTGSLKINGRSAYIASQDFLVSGGSLGQAHGQKIALSIKAALKTGVPMIFINDSGGARIQEGVDALSGYGDIFHLNVAAHHKIPQIALIMGPCAGGAVYSPALTDFVFMVKNTSYMYLTGPSIVKKVTYEDVTHESLGGANVHGNKSGVADFICDNDIDALNKLKILLSYLPSNSKEKAPHSWVKKNIKDNKFLNYFLPANKNQSYDMLNLIDEILDDSSFFEVKKDFAKNIIIGFGRVQGQSVGIIANQPLELAGCLDINASLKAEKFIRFCNAFNIPLITLVDVPGFLPGTYQEYNGVINHGSKLLFAYSEASVPKITVIVRKAYGGAYIVMNSKHLGADFNFAWTNSEIAVMGAEGATELLIKDKNDLEKMQSFNKEYASIMSPEYAARKGFIDDIIEPAQTRQVICKALKGLIAK